MNTCTRRQLYLIRFTAIMIKMINRKHCKYRINVYACNNIHIKLPHEVTNQRAYRK